MSTGPLRLDRDDEIEAAILEMFNYEDETMSRLAAARILTAMLATMDRIATAIELIAEDRS